MMLLITINMIGIIDRWEKVRSFLIVCLCMGFFNIFGVKKRGEFWDIYQLDIDISLLGMHLPLCILFDCLSFGLALRSHFRCLLLLLLRCSLMFLLEEVICKRTSPLSMCKEEPLSILDNGTKIEKQCIQIFLIDLPEQFLYHLFSHLNQLHC